MLITALLCGPAYAAPKIYWTDAPYGPGDTISRANLDGTGVEDIITTGLGAPAGLAMDLAAGKIYFTDVETDKIQRANLDGTGVEDLVTTGLVHPFDIVLDTAAGKMYWADAAGKNIKRADLDGGNIETIVSTGLKYPKAIALDTTIGKIYWADSWYPSGIKRANLDGTNIEIIINTDLGDPSGLAIDTTNGKLYFTDAAGIYARIERCDLDGTNREQLVTTELWWPKGIILDIEGGKMYWTDAWYPGDIKRASLDGSNVETIVTSLSNPADLALFIQEPTNLEISGPDEILENSSAQFTATAQYVDSSTAEVTGMVNWSVQPDTFATIDENGLLTTGDIDTATDFTVHAEYKVSLFMVEDEVTVHVPQPTNLNVMGPGELLENSQGQFQAIVHYDNGWTRDVTENTFWQIQPDTFADIDANGLLTIANITSDDDVNVFAEYSASGITVDFQRQVHIPLAIELTITGPDKARFTFPEQYKATVYYDNGADRDVTDWVSWNLQQTIYASIDNYGLLTSQEVNEPHDVNIITQYTQSLNPLEGTLIIEIVPVNRIYVPDDYYNIQDAIDVADYYDIAIVRDGTYTGPRNKNLRFYGKPIILKSENGPDYTIINCEGNGKGLALYHYETKRSIVDGFTIINGNANYGGGIEIGYRSNPTIKNCIISENRADDYGGGIYCSSYSKATFINCIITENSARRCAGIYCGYENQITISNCVISNNSADHYYGGIYCSSYSKTTISDCIINDNKAGRGIAAICCGWRSTLTIENCIIAGNRANDWSGAINCDGQSSPTFNNCVITNNSTVWNGSGITAWDSTATFNNCTITNNTASGAPGWCGGIYIRNENPADVPKFNNCIIWANIPSQINARSQVPVTYTDIQGNWPGQGNISAPPIFEPNDFHLMDGSLCINAGEPNSDYTDQSDIDYQPRVIANRIDMGADEFHGNNSAPVADAGQDQTIFIDNFGTTEVTLDGTNSYDDDNHPLTYLWSWTVDGNDFNDTKPVCTIELPIGQHTIELIVNDRIENSLPDEAVIEIIPPLEVDMKFTPAKLKCNSKGNWVKAHFTLPEGFLPEDVDVGTPAALSPMDISSEYIETYLNDEGLAEIEIAFDREVFCGAVTESGLVELTVTGSLTTGQYFFGTDTIIIK